MGPGDEAMSYAVPSSEPSSPLSEGQRADLSRVVAKARAISGFGFAIYVGPLPEGRASALGRHAGLPSAESAVLVAVDPAARAIEIVTGSTVAVDLDNRSCELAVLAMKSSFSADDLVGGLRDAVNLLAQHARAPEVMHLSEPD